MPLVGVSGHQIDFLYAPRIYKNLFNYLPRFLIKHVCQYLPQDLTGHFAASIIIQKKLTVLQKIAPAVSEICLILEFMFALNTFNK